jgi:hypothetical protein
MRDVPRPYRKFHDQTQEPDSTRRYDAAELVIEYCQTTDIDDGRALRPRARTVRSRHRNRCRRHPFALPHVRLRRAISVKGK